MRHVIGCVLFALLLAIAFCTAQADVLMPIWQGLKNVFNALADHAFSRHPASRPRFDIARARRESHALGLPFPESDGTLSQPPEPGAVDDRPVDVAERLHDGRFVIDRLRRRGEGPDPVWADRARREGWACSSHGDGCDLRTEWCRLIPYGWRKV